MNPMKRLIKAVIGIDEVGRGPIAGPVAVGVFIFLDGLTPRHFRGVKESKQLNESQREAWFSKVDSRHFVVTMVSEKIIDKKGIAPAIRHALSQSLTKLIKVHKIKPKNCLALLDGGLKAPPEFIHQKTIIKGDAKKSVIALASICAKVTRDRHMNRFAKKYPYYGFENHKGYGTKAHYAAIAKYGLLSVHRKSFLKSVVSRVPGKAGR